MARGRKGRPRKAAARSRATTRAGRAPLPDLGTEEVRRLRQLLNGRLDLPTDPLAALYSREFIDERSYRAGRYFQALTLIARHGWGLKDASVEGLWRTLVAGTPSDQPSAVPMVNGHDRTAADAARRRLETMRSELLEADKTGAVLQAVMTVCVDGRWTGWVKNILSRNPGLPSDWRSLGALREGLWRLGELERVPPERKGVRVTPARAAAAE